MAFSMKSKTSPSNTQGPKTYKIQVSYWGTITGIIGFGILFSLAVMFLYYKGNTFLRIEKSQAISLGTGLIGALSAILISIIMARYLNSTKVKRSDVNKLLFKEKNELNNTINAKLNDLSLGSFSEIVEELRIRVEEKATNEFLNDIKSSIKNEEFRFDVFQRGQSTLERIYKEIEALGRRGNLNLILGVISALAGICALFFFVISTKAHESIYAFIIQFTPRLSIVFIIEVFSYFFLRLYKSSLIEIKYFQNEATNIENYFTALETAIHLKDKGLIKKCTEAFINTERNPLMNKDQMTRELLSEKATIDSMPISTDNLVKILDAMKGNKKD